jgi:hypothetical protein
VVHLLITSAYGNRNTEHLGRLRDDRRKNRGAFMYTTVHPEQLIRFF